MTFCPQVPFFLFVVFVVYTLLPFSMQGAVVVGVISSTSHLLVLGTLMEDFSKSSMKVGLQVMVLGAQPRPLGGGCALGRGQPDPWGELVLRLHSLVCRQMASRTGFLWKPAPGWATRPCGLRFAGLWYLRG